VGLDPVQTLGAAMVVLFLGSFVVWHVGFRNNDIPAPVVDRIIVARSSSTCRTQS
jgi:Na+/glutamate symporter